MSKVLKYKKGFTWRHHLDEKWDRLDYSFKLKIQAFFLIFLLGVCVLVLAWANQKHEKAQFIQQSTARGEAVQEKVDMGKSRGVPPPTLRQAEE